MISNLANEIIVKIKEEQLLKVKKEENINLWIISLFEELKKMEIDPRGKFGEKLLYTILSNDTYYKIEYNGDANTGETDGIYDMKINGKRVEIKTATIGSNGVFQHENLKNDNKCDVYLLLDISKEYIYLTVLNKDISFSDYTEETGLKIPQFDSVNKRSKKGGAAFHNRPGSDNFKLTINPNTSIKFSIENGKTISIYDDDYTPIINFLKKYF